MYMCLRKHTCTCIHNHNTYNTYINVHVHTCIAVIEMLWSADQAQELVREWLDLVRERDKLLHEEIQQVSVCMHSYTFPCIHIYVYIQYFIQYILS